MQRYRWVVILGLLGFLSGMAAAADPATDTYDTRMRWAPCTVDEGGVDLEPGELVSYTIWRGATEQAVMTKALEVPPTITQIFVHVIPGVERGHWLAVSCTSTGGPSDRSSPIQWRPPANPEWVQMWETGAPPTPPAPEAKP